eukprot:scaffold40981_cov48-Phaeocystis_antarctica.AAC.5
MSSAPSAGMPECSSRALVRVRVRNRVRVRARARARVRGAEAVPKEAGPEREHQLEGLVGVVRLEAALRHEALAQGLEADAEHARRHRALGRRRVRGALAHQLESLDRRRRVVPVCPCGVGEVGAPARHGGCGTRDGRACEG